MLKSADNTRLIVSLAESSLIRNAARPFFIPFKIWVAFQVACAYQSRIREAVQKEEQA